MVSDLSLAAEQLARGRCSVAACKQGQILGMESGRGIGPFMLLTERLGPQLQSAALADVAVGRAVALAAAHLGVTALYASRLSAGAAEVLGAAGIRWQADRVIPFILNRDGTGPCPIEQLVSEITDPAQVLPRLRSFLTAMIHGGTRR